MLKNLILFVFLLPLVGFAQYTISGRVLNQADTKLLANVSVFLSSTTIGATTAMDGTFTLTGVMPGKYTLIVSAIGFETHNQAITISGSNVVLPGILMFPKTLALSEVTIKAHKGSNADKYLAWFKSEFLGQSDRAKDCEIINPDALAFNYDEAADKLMASSYGPLEIKNDALGYLVKYEITNFLLEHRDKDDKRVYYEGPVQMEQLKGTKNEMLRWNHNREAVYENSPMHFLRSALNNTLAEDGFSVQQYAIYANPERPADTLINRKISYYNDLKNKTTSQKDSLTWWMKKARLKKTFQTLMSYQLSGQEIVSAAGLPGQYALGCENDGLLVIYHSSSRFHLSGELSLGNPAATLINFNAPEAYFNRDGSITNPYSAIYYGAWGNARVAELLPTNYEAPTKSGAGNDHAVLNQVMAKLDTFKKTHIREKAYLQFDKPYYAAGDTIYFKAYVTMGEEHLPSNISGVLHVDLLNTQNKVDQSLKLPLTDGAAWGDFSLPDSLPKGNYNIRAYTRWMLNDGNYYTRDMTIGSLKDNKVPEAGSPQASVPKGTPDMQFLPEGGAMVAGLNLKIAFKSLNTNGKGLGARGVIIDDENQQVCVFEAGHLGMGFFTMKPRPGITYRAEVTFANGATSTIALPAIVAKGMALSVDNISIPKAGVKIAVNEACYLENKGKNYMLAIKSGDMVNMVSFRLDSPVMTFDILKRKLHTGIASVTLLSPAGEPLMERLFFVQNYEQLTLDVSSDKALYAKRGKVSLKLQASDRTTTPVQGHFSVSVTDEGKVPDDGHNDNNILSSLLLTSDLRGYVEQPNDYFRDTSMAAASLDLLMLTQGYRGYSMRRMLTDNPPVKYQPETGLAINGIVKNLFGKPIANATVTLITVKGGALISSTSDANGIFRFDGLDFADTTRFVLSAVNANGKNTTQITYVVDKQEPELTAAKPKNKPAVADTLLLPYMNNYRLQQSENIKYGRIHGILLKNVTIKAKAAPKPNIHNNLVSPEFADQVILPDQMPKGGSFSSRLEAVIHGAHVERIPVTLETKAGSYAFLNRASNYIRRPMRVIVDGTDSDGDLDELTGMPIESIEVLTSPGNIGAYGGLTLPPGRMYRGGYEGVLVITTAINKVDVASIGILPFTPKGFYKAREFYAPKYDYAPAAAGPADLRGTIFWKPELITAKDGIASFDFYNADGTGTYKVTIEGIDSKGNLGRQVYRYKVE
jgi:hypothetical protein